MTSKHKPEIRQPLTVVSLNLKQPKQTKKRGPGESQTQEEEGWILTKQPNPSKKRKLDESQSREEGDGRPVKRRRTTTIKDRISTDVAHIDTGVKNDGIIENPFKDIVLIKGSEINHINILFGKISKHIVELMETMYTIYGAANIYFVGCIAWFSHPTILKSMAKCAGVQIIVNDEPYRTWGGGGMPKKYDCLPRISHPFNVIFKKSPNKVMKGLDPLGVSLKTGGHFASVRALGTRDEGGDGTEKAPIFQSGAILHSKYFIPCFWGGPKTKFQPLGVFMGSMNLTKKASQNQENMLWISSERVGEEYFNDYTRSFIASKPIRR